MARIRFTKEYLNSIRQTARQGKDPDLLWDCYAASNSTRSAEEYLAAAEGFRDYSRKRPEGLDFATGCLRNAIYALERDLKEGRESREEAVINCKSIKKLAQNLGHIYRQENVRGPLQEDEKNGETEYQRQEKRQSRKQGYKKFLNGHGNLLGIKGILEIAGKIEKENAK